MKELSPTPPPPLAPILLLMTSAFMVGVFLTMPYRSERLEDSVFELHFRNVSRQAVFMIETAGHVSLEHTCALESLAAVSQDSDVYLLISDPPDEFTASPSLRAVLARYGRVRVLGLRSAPLFLASPLRDLYQSGELLSSRTLHNTLLRLLVLHQYGGVFLDSDFILRKSVSGLGNFVSTEHGRSDSLSLKALGFSRYHPLLEEALYLAAIHPDPKVLTRVFLSRCTGVGTPRDPAECEGVAVLPSKRFLTLSRAQYEEWQGLMGEWGLEAVLERLWGSLGVEGWEEGLVGEDRGLYERLARHFCPITTAMSQVYLAH